MMTYNWSISIIGASLATDKSDTMKIEIITTENENFKRDWIWLCKSLQ